MLCCEDGCGYTAIYIDRCHDHVLEYRRKYPGWARQYDEDAVGAEIAKRNALGKKLLERLKEARNGQGQDT